jgi:antitoxin PrlF
MAEMKRMASCDHPANKAKSCCRIESLLTIDERGQMVLPKELRERAGIHAGDKLALISWVKDGCICCLSLIKAEMLETQVKDILGPIMSDLNPSNTR